ncbi:universal stress protein [Cupriavidus campinensis]
MSYKTMLVEVGHDAGCRDRLRAAALLAARFGAHLTGLTATGVRLGAPRGGPDGTARLAELERDRLRSHAVAFGELMRDMVAEAGVDIGCSHEVVEDEEGAAFIRKGRYADLVLLAQRPRTGMVPALVTDLPEQVLLATGRPAILVPQRPPPLHGGHVVIAWDGGREAARAVADALPMLCHARHVSVIGNGDPTDPHDGDADRHGGSATGLRGWLLRHGIVAAQLGLPAGREPVADRILSVARQAGADMIVAGCYGHSRVRELVIGGTTRALLQRSPLPVLMAH